MSKLVWKRAQQQLSRHPFDEFIVLALRWLCLNLTHSLTSPFYFRLFLFVPSINTSYIARRVRGMCDMPSIFYHSNTRCKFPTYLSQKHVLFRIEKKKMKKRCCVSLLKIWTVSFHCVVMFRFPLNNKIEKIKIEPKRRRIPILQYLLCGARAVRSDLYASRECARSQIYIVGSTIFTFSFCILLLFSPFVCANMLLCAE